MFKYFNNILKEISTNNDIMSESTSHTVSAVFTFKDVASKNKFINFYSFKEYYFFSRLFS